MPQSESVPRHSIRAAACELRRILAEVHGARSAIERDLSLTRIEFVARDLDALCDEAAHADTEPPPTDRSAQLSDYAAMTCLACEAEGDGRKRAGYNHSCRRGEP